MNSSLLRCCTCYNLTGLLEHLELNRFTSVLIPKIEIIETFPSYSESLISIVGGGRRFIAEMLLHRQQYLVRRYRFSLFLRVSLLS